MSKEQSYQNHPNNPGAQPFKGAPKKNMAHWSNVRGNNNTSKKKGDQ